MQQFDPLISAPVRSLQNDLRRISYTYDDIPHVVPDGIYGVQTQNSVIALQKKFGLPQTGVADKQTIDKVSSVINEIITNEGEPTNVRIYPNAQFEIHPNQGSIHIIPIQAMVLVLTKTFPQLGTLEITGINDAQSVAVIKNMQKLFAMKQTGIIDKAFWQKLVPFYEAHISRKRT